MASIPDFTDTETWSLRTVVKERYGKDVELQLADAELRLDPDSTTLTPCPAVFWSECGANFVIFKVGENRYRCQFFYGRREQFGTGPRGVRQPRRVRHRAAAGAGRPRARPGPAHGQESKLLTFNLNQYY